MILLALRTAWPSAEGKRIKTTTTKTTAVVNVVGKMSSGPMDGEQMQRLLSIFYLSVQPGQHRAKL